MAATVKLTVGNTHQKVKDKDSHKWCMYVRPEKHVRSVTFHLHKTFNPPIVTVSKPPFEIGRIGWGYFTVNADITLSDGSIVKVAHELSFEKSDTNKDYVFPIAAASSATPSLWDTLSQDCVFAILNLLTVSDFSKFCRTCTSYKTIFTKDDFWINKHYSVIPDTEAGHWFTKSRELLDGWGPIVDNVQLQLSVKAWSATISARNLSKTDWAVLPFLVNSKVVAWALELSAKYNDYKTFEHCCSLYHEDPQTYMEMIPDTPTWAGYQVLPPGKTQSFSYGIEAIMPACCEVPRPIHSRACHPSVEMQAHRNWLHMIRKKVDSHKVHFPMLFRAHSSAGPWVKSSAKPDEEFLSDVPKEPKKESQKKGKLIKIGNDLEDDEEIKKIKDPEKRAKKLAQKISESSAMHGIPSHAVYIVQFDDDDEYGWRRRRRGFFGDDNDDKKVEFHLPKGQKLVYVSSALETSAVLRENA